MAPNAQYLTIVGILCASLEIKYTRYDFVPEGLAYEGYVYSLEWKRRRFPESPYYPM